MRLILEILRYLAEDLLTFNGTLYQQPSWEPFLYKMPSYQYIPLKSDDHFIFIHVMVMPMPGTTVFILKGSPGVHLNIDTIFPGVGISIMKIRQSWDHLIFIMGTSLLLRRHLYIKTAPWWPFMGLLHVDDLMQDSNISNSEHCNSQMVLSEAMAECRFNSLYPGRCGCNSKISIVLFSKHILIHCSPGGRTFLFN